ncbi:hypothetical protein BT93_D0174 [Corymbia citriodora subsp. variegata]|nr:hypothetical protein BT93_D0174 [Corymbia citriodora subsp. variegata]
MLCFLYCRNPPMILLFLIMPFYIQHGCIRKLKAWRSCLIVGFWNLFLLKQTRSWLTLFRFFHLSNFATREYQTCKSKHFYSDCSAYILLSSGLERDTMA